MLRTERLVTLANIGQDFLKIAEDIGSEELYAIGADLLEQAETGGDPEELHKLAYYVDAIYRETGDEVAGEYAGEIEKVAADTYFTRIKTPEDAKNLSLYKGVIGGVLGAGAGAVVGSKMPLVGLGIGGAIGGVAGALSGRQDRVRNNAAYLFAQRIEDGGHIRPTHYISHGENGKFKDRLQLYRENGQGRGHLVVRSYDKSPDKSVIWARLRPSGLYETSPGKFVSV